MKKSKLAVVAVSIAFSSLFLSRAAYAGTSISVANSGGAISFGKVQPSASGTVTTASDTLTITTDCSAGSNVYISAVNGSSSGTSLVNNAADSNNTISTLSGTTIGTTALTLENNTWGFNTTNNNTYYGLPAYANAMEHAIYSGTNTTIPIYYGAKVTSALTPGKYTGQVLYTATVNSSCLNYTVIFNKNANDATGTMSNQTMAPSAATVLTTNAFERPGYVFLGWSTDQNATTPTYTDGQSVTDIAPGGGSVTLYAVWGRTMQGWAEDFGCTTITIGSTTDLYDARDSSKYTVRRFSDGSCWMIQNLHIGYDKPYTLTKNDTNISDNGSYYLPQAGKQANLDGTSVADANFSTSSDNQARVQYATTSDLLAKNSSLANAQDTGYYNFYAATLGKSYYGLNGYVSGYVERDICPKGWQLPVNDSSNHRSWDYFYNTLNGGQHANLMSASGASLLYSGLYSSSSLSEVGSGGYWWSSTVNNTNNRYALYVSSYGSVYPLGNDYLYYGFAVRCVAKTANATGYMQDFDNNLLSTVGQAAILQDKRDSKEYIVKRLQDGKVWMVQNLTVNGVALTPDDTNIDNGATYYLPRDGGMGNITTASTANSTSGWNFTSGNSNKAIFKFRSKNTDYVNDSDTGYYNFYTATLGFSYYNDGKTSGSSTRDICPKGWRLPRVTDNGNTVSSGSPAEFANLAKSYNPEASWVDNSTSYNYHTSDSLIHTGYHTGIAANGNGYAGFSYNGTYSSTTLYSIGSEGYYWSSSVYDSVSSYYMFFNSSDVRPQVGNNIYNGMAVRCIAKDNMQDVSVASLPESQTSILNDKRDNQDYTVYRWPSTGTAGSSYPTGMAGYAIMTKDLSLGYVTSGSVTRGGDLVLTMDESAAAGTIIARTGASDWSGGGDSLQYTNGANATYGAHSYYSYGAAQKVCPKGWRLPTNSEYSNIATFMGGNNSTGSSKIKSSTYNFIYGGFLYTGGWLEVGSSGYYWSSTQDGSSGYDLILSSSALYTNLGTKYVGMSVRCIASPN